MWSAYTIWRLDSSSSPGDGNFRVDASKPWLKVNMLLNSRSCISSGKPTTKMVLMLSDDGDSMDAEWNSFCGRNYRKGLKHAGAYLCIDRGHAMLNEH